MKGAKQLFMRATTREFRGYSSGSETAGNQRSLRIIPNRPGFKTVIVLLIVLTAFVLIQCFLPVNTAIQIGADEGFELAKATLCLNGYKLYSAVWNDQPPLHTFLITQILRHISPSVLGPRLLTSVFAARMGRRSA